MTARADRDELLLRYLDGALSPGETKQLETLLREDAAARECLRQIAEQAVAMGDLARARALEMPPPPMVSRTRFQSMPWLAMAAAFALLAGVAALWLHLLPPSEALLVEVVELEGAASFSGMNGGSRHTVAKGERLTAGTLEAEGEGAEVRVRFDDGSLLALGGESELSFAEEAGRKLIWLRRGTLSAQVQPQPAGQRMRLRTATAEMEVVGTVFTLAARADDTLLEVNEGLVKLKRLTDGRVIDVPAQSSAVASLDPAGMLGASAIPDAQTVWGFDFTREMPPDRWRGTWYPAVEGKPGRMVSKAYVAGRAPDGRAVTHYGISLRPAYLDPPLQLLARPDSVVRVRLKLNHAATLQIMLLTKTVSGSYGGNFERRIEPHELHPGDDGWSQLELSLRDFTPTAQSAARHRSAVGKILNGVLISSLETDTQLTISHFDLLTR
jgi:ferric-dicitrate binding protein FerR (iron transport regulator)